MLDAHIIQFLLQAESKALATYGPQGINVVPVSSIRVVDGKVWLINYFMEKTLENILAGQPVALTAWSKMMGYQIKGTVEYKAEGAAFDQAVAWIKDILPDRTVRGLIILSPTDIHDIAPTKNTKEKFEAHQSQ